MRECRALVVGGGIRPPGRSAVVRSGVIWCRWVVRVGLCRCPDGQVHHEGGAGSGGPSGGDRSPWAETMALTIESPRPAPPWVRDREGSDR